MRSDRFSRGKAFQSWIFWVAMPPVVFFIWPFVRFLSEQSAFLIGVAAVLFAVGGVILFVTSRVNSAPLARYVDESRDGQPAPETCRAAFRTLMDLPRYTFLVGYVAWCTGGFIAAGFAGGLVSQIFSYLWLRRNLESLRSQIAADVLGQEVERVASGDLTPGRIFESEDEFGDLARSFARMASSLRTAARSASNRPSRAWMPSAARPRPPRA
jgi:HAMP domain-containing protein